MAVLHVKAPNGTTKSLDLTTVAQMNFNYAVNGWVKIDTGSYTRNLLIQWMRIGLTDMGTVTLSPNSSQDWSATFPISFSASDIRTAFAQLTNFKSLYFSLDILHSKDGVTIRVNNFDRTYTHNIDANVRLMIIGVNNA